MHPSGTAVAVSYRIGEAPDQTGVFVLLDTETGQQIGPGTSMGADPWGLAFSPEGVLATMDALGTLSFWRVDLEAVTPIEAVGSSQRIEGMFTRSSIRCTPGGIQLSWSPNGERLAVAHNATGRVSLWTGAGEHVASWEGEPRRSDEAVTWNRAGTLFAFADGEFVRFREGRTGKPVTKGGLRDGLHCRGPVVSMALHPSRNVLATGHADCLVRLWDLRTGRPLAWANYRDAFDPDPEEEVASMDWTPSGSRLAVSTRTSCTVFVLEPESLCVVWSSGYLGGDFGFAFPVAWSPNGRDLWFAFGDGHGATRVSPEREPEPSLGHVRWLLEGRAGLPTFAGGLGALIHNGKVRLVEADGGIRW